MKSYHSKEKGQSAVEFILIAPFLFFIFFAIIQLSYTAYVSFAVQRAALAVARTASLNGPDNKAPFQTQLTISLLPLANLSHKTLLTILACSCTVYVSPDKKRVTARVHYPMPIWVPLVDRVFGETLVPAMDYSSTPEGQTIQTVFRMMNLSPLPDLSFRGVRLPVCWVSYEATTFNEGYRR